MLPQIKPMIKVNLQPLNFQGNRPLLFQPDDVFTICCKTTIDAISTL